MVNKFNVSRYRELLKKKDILEEQNKFLFDDPDYLELLSYQATVYRQIYFSRKSDYCSLIKKYLNTTIPSHKFRARFLEMVKQDDEKAEKILQDFKQLSSFSIDVNLDGFSSLFGRISNNCLQAFEFGPKNDGYGIPEDEFRNSIEEIYFQLENYLNEIILTLHSNSFIFPLYQHFKPIIFLKVKYPAKSLIPPSWA